MVQRHCGEILKYSSATSLGSSELNLNQTLLSGFELESWDVSLTFTFCMSSLTFITINSNEDDSKMVDWRV